MNPTPKPSRGVHYYMRAIHRVVGYLTVGLVLVYGISGILLIHRTNDFMKKTVHVEAVLPTGLSADALGAELKMKTYKVVEETDQAVVFNTGTYDKASGQASYDKKEVVWPFNTFIRLHKLSEKQNPTVGVFTMAFGIALLLLAVTSLFMFRARGRLFWRNMLYTALGVALAVVLLCVA